MNPYTLPLDNMNVIHIPHRFIQPVEENVENDFILFTTRCIAVFGVKHGGEPGSKRLLEDEGLRDRCLSQESKHLGHTGSSLTGMHKMVTLKPRGETMRINTESTKSRAFFRGFSRVFD